MGIRLIAVSSGADATIGDTSVFQCNMPLGSCSLQYYIETNNAPDTVFVVSNPQSTLTVACPYVTDVQL